MTPTTPTLTEVAANWSALVSAPLQSPIDITPSGATNNTPVWTGTGATGMVDSGATCNSWTDNDGAYSGDYAYSTNTSGNWSINGPIACYPADQAALWCFQQ